MPPLSGDLPPSPPTSSPSVRLRRVLDRVLSSKQAVNVIDCRYQPPREGQPAPWPAYLPARVRRALQERGMTAPWSHQAAAWDALRRGEDVMVITATASGKTACYQVPTLSALLDDAGGTALYLYPTKALAQDQCAAFNALADAADVSERAWVYDGDTPQDQRRTIRQHGRVVLTNPDMLHTAILPNHDKWRAFFSNLRLVVLDEAHTYRGVFGSHVANVLRRLTRVAAAYGASPSFVLTSATLANAAEFGARLLGRAPVVVPTDGAPQGERWVVLYNPPLVRRETHERMSAPAAARRLALLLLEEDLGTILFVRSRQAVETTTRSLKDQLSKMGAVGRRRAGQVQGYRGGYLPTERRRIEEGLRAGAVQAVVSTNALELGIDIGALDACLMAGYPGTIASVWQQAGRAGRRRGGGLAVLIASDDPVDQYLVRHPDVFFGASPEHARIDPDNLRILAEHLKCAAFELPFGEEEGFGDVPVPLAQEVLRFLAEETGTLTLAEGRWRWSDRAFPAEQVSLRNIADENFVIFDTSHTPHDVLGEIDFVAAHTTVYEQAIYQHRARLYEVHRLDYPARKAFVRPVDVDYYTQAMEDRKVFLLDRFADSEGDIRWGCGEVRVCSHVRGYKKIRFKTRENIGYGEIHLPDLETHTTAWWMTVEDALRQRLALSMELWAEALEGVGKVLHVVAVVQLMCSQQDLFVVQGTGEGDAWQPAAGLPPTDDGPHALQQGTLLDAPTLFLVDRCPGGVGFAEKLWHLRERLMEEALRLIQGCDCEEGCPACMGPPSPVAPMAGRKEAARQVLVAAASAAGVSGSEGQP